ncbi:hypothetical protein V6N11_017156 [Hibiscus sabdariffa]|uniref:Uncharacterized protein n=1 Tax=Hibiscus sabdariffa TaxID=183260 RepID=A0ABR2TXC3_9ROSI
MASFSGPFPLAQSEIFRKDSSFGLSLDGFTPCDEAIVVPLRYFLFFTLSHCGGRRLCLCLPTIIDTRFNATGCSLAFQVTVPMLQ